MKWGWPLLAGMQGFGIAMVLLKPPLHEQPIPAAEQVIPAGYAFPAESHSHFCLDKEGAAYSEGAIVGGATVGAPSNSMSCRKSQPGIAGGVVLMTWTPT